MFAFAATMGLALRRLFICLLARSHRLLQFPPEHIGEDTSLVSIYNILSLGSKPYRFANLLISKLDGLITQLGGDEMVGIAVMNHMDLSHFQRRKLGTMHRNTMGSNIMYWLDPESNRVLRTDRPRLGIDSRRNHKPQTPSWYSHV
jgi:hypothetical protein